jgi:hypothetical protein
VLAGLIGETGSVSLCGLDRLVGPFGVEPVDPIRPPLASRCVWRCGS